MAMAGHGIRGVMERKKGMNMTCKVARIWLWTLGIAGLWTTCAWGAPSGGGSSVVINGVWHPTRQDFYASSQFRAESRRCGTMMRNPSLNELRRKRAKADPSDCTSTRTAIQDTYWPTQALSIRVVVHVIHREDGTGNVDDDRIARQIAVLNEDYAALAGSLGEQGFDVKIRFVLAGITRTANDAWHEDSDESAYKEALAWDVSRYCNVYVNTAGGYLGYAYFPQDDVGKLDGLVISYDAFGGRDEGSNPYDQGRTTVHEMGHYLGLYHTFEGYSDCLNTYTNGDLIVDTPAESTDHYGCEPSTTCGTDDPIHNYMNYTDDACMREFTPEQANRMVCALTSYRSGLMETYPFDVQPLAIWKSAGPVGGPFLPTGTVYAVSNGAAVSIEWTASATQPWLAVTPASGTLVSGGVAQVSVSVVASNVPAEVGSHAASVVFSNATAGAALERGVNLSAYAILPAASGPLAGGNSIVVTNGHFGAITNVRFGAVDIMPSEWGSNWFGLVVPAGAVTGAVDVVVQTSDNGETSLFGAYEYEAPISDVELSIVSAYGVGDPPPGNYTNPVDTVATNTMDPFDTRGTTQYVCSGWALAGHEPAVGTGTSVVLRLTNDAVLTWQWTTNYWLETESTTNGAIDPASSWLPAGSSVWVEAQAATNYRFAEWTGDASGTNNPVEIAMDGAKSVGAIFELVPVQGWDSGYQDLGGGWRRLGWFGDYVPMSVDGWIWHNKHGFFYVATNATPENAWMFALDMGWLYTGNALYPFLYRSGDSAWLWYNGATNPRWFINFSTGQWEYWP